MNLKRYDRDYRGDLIPRAEGPLCLYSEVHDMSEALTMACDERDSLLAECETLRRKARAFDEIREHIEHVGGDYRIRATFCYPHESHATIEAALAAKEQGNG